MVKKIPVIAINVVTNKIYFYNSISEAARNCDLSDRSVYDVLKKYKSQAGLFTFKYADKLKPLNNDTKNKTN